MKCLNCGHIALKKHCPKCGQKTSTHRFTLASIFDYAVLNAYFSLNAGLLFTVKELLLRPGYAVREYLQGKRAKYLNAFSLFLVMLALSLFLENLFVDVQKEQDDFVKFFQESPRLGTILLIPTLSLASYLIFFKGKLHFAEHLVASVYAFSMLLFLGVLDSSIRLFATNFAISDPTEWSFIIYSAYFIYFYFQLFSNLKLNKINLLFRVIGMFFLFLVFSGIVLTLILSVKKMLVY